MKELQFKQEKPITVVMLGVLLLLLGLINYSDVSGMLVTVSLGLVLLGYRISYRITKEFSIYKRFSLFGIVVFKRKEDITFPKYISLYSTSLSKPNDWGPVSALGTRSGVDRFVIRLFNDEDSFKLYRSNDIINTREKAYQLRDLLKVELVDKTLEI